jgi:hypothetical protein
MREEEEVVLELLLLLLLLLLDDEMDDGRRGAAADRGRRRREDDDDIPRLLSQSINKVCVRDKSTSVANEFCIHGCAMTSFMVNRQDGLTTIIRAIKSCAADDGTAVISYGVVWAVILE